MGANNQSISDRRESERMGKKTEGKRKAGDEIGKEGWEKHKITIEF